MAFGNCEGFAFGKDACDFGFALGWRLRYICVWLCAGDKSDSREGTEEDYRRSDNGSCNSRRHGQYF